MSFALLLLGPGDAAIVAAIAGRGWELPKGPGDVAKVARFSRAKNSNVKRVVEILENTELLDEAGRPHANLVKYLNKQSTYMHEDRADDCGDDGF